MAIAGYAGGGQPEPMAERNAERERVALERARAMAAAQRGDRGASSSPAALMTQL
jgi:hypothetical protein